MENGKFKSRKFILVVGIVAGLYMGGNVAQKIGGK